KRRNLTSIQTLSTFKKALKKDEFALHFNVMALYLRCIHLLRRIQEHCLTHAPLDYPWEAFHEGLDMNHVINCMMLDLAGARRLHGSMFPAAVKFLREVIEKEGDTEYAQATARCEMKPNGGDTKVDEIEPSFENPPEDSMPLLTRGMFWMVVVRDENGDCRMPFG
ncbi:hypothetical protein BU26DRAFT_382305, partial [Trematosphaeria pertusa]